MELYLTFNNIGLLLEFFSQHNVMQLVKHYNNKSKKSHIKELQAIKIKVGNVLFLSVKFGNCLSI